ncbi:MAG: divergent polysaccharide deacetylase family protein, partial [Paracoccaceae bacterium]
MSDSGQYRREREIDKPLGQTAQRKPVRRFALSRSASFAVLCTVALAGTAGYVALANKPFRTLSPEVSVVPDSAPPAATPGKDPGSQTASKTDGPAIITVPPDNAKPAGVPVTDPSGSVIVIRDPSALSQNPRTAHLPDRALIEQSEFGPLPVKGADGRRPFDVYAGTWSGTRGARVALVIGGLGLSQTGTQAAIKTLPGEVTLAFSPQGNSLNRWMQDARRAGHEVLIQIPFEPFDYPRINP